ncbi:hypothetical protein L7F22_061982 [Adiantum nelumboides]|nr:hypothetical protein [Adiantum nelumboides]
MTCDAKKIAFQCLLGLRAFRYLHHASEKSILSNIQGTSIKVKESLSEEELKIKRAACMMLVNSKGDPSRSISNSKMAKFTGLHRRNFAAANLRLKQAEAGAFPLQLCSRQLPQSSTITHATKDLVFSFWHTETRVSPKKKDVCQKRLGRKSYIKHPIYLLDDSQFPKKNFCPALTVGHCFKYYSLTGIEMLWSFFASSHGKGEHDGAGAVVKRA